MNLTAILKAALFTPANGGLWGLPLLYEGEPGVGKTAILGQLCAEVGLHCEVVIASLREPADFLGLPVPHGDRVNYLPPSWVTRAAAARRAVVFLDELNTAAPATQAAVLRAVNERCVGDFQLPPTVRFVAAQNKTEDAAGGWDLAPPMANRFGHLRWEAPDISAWSAWLIGGANSASVAGGTSAEDLEKNVLASWDKQFAMASGLVAGFLRSRGALLHAMPKSGDPNASKAWPSPRTWEMATRAIAGAAVHGLSPADADEFVAAFVGNAAAMELITFRQNADLPDPEDVLDEKVKFEHDPRRLDRTCAALGACAAFLNNPKLPRRNERAAVLWRVMVPIVKKAPDVVFQAAVTMAANHLTTMKEAIDCLEIISPVLKAANVQPKARR